MDVFISLCFCLARNISEAAEIITKTEPYTFCQYSARDMSNDNVMTIKYHAPPLSAGKKSGDTHDSVGLSFSELANGLPFLRFFCLSILPVLSVSD
jgi:hypothetical protein